MPYPQGDHCELRRPRPGSGSMREGNSGRGSIAWLQRTPYRGRCAPPLPSQQVGARALEEKKKNTKPTKPYKSAQVYQQHALEPSSSRGQPTSPHLPSQSHPVSTSPPGPQRGWCRSRLPVPSAPRFLPKSFPVPTSPAQLSAVSDHGPRIISSS